MAKFNPIHGTLSGRLGGSIYSYNKGGFYVRNYVPQVWAGTPAQVIAKNNFSLIQTYWSTITLEQRAAWQYFADNLFLPLNKFNGVSYTARSAAAALYLTVLSNIQYARHAILKIGSYTPARYGYAFTASTNPPNYRFCNLIQTSTGDPLGFKLTNCDVYSNSYFKAYFTLDQKIVMNPILYNPNQTEYIGFQFYCSNPINAAKNYFISPLLFTLGSFGCVFLHNPVHLSPTNSMTLDFSFDVLNIANYKVFPVADDKVRITAYLVSQSGQKALIGSYDTIVLP